MKLILKIMYINYVTTNTHFKLIIIVLLFISSCNHKSNYQKKASRNDKWVRLFNGKNLSGWVQLEGDSKYTVENGNIVGKTTPNGGNGILATKKSYSNFVLKLDVKADTALNSGIQVRSHMNNREEVYGYQIEIDPSKRAWSGGIYDSRRRGWLVDLKNKPKAQKAFKNGQWNHYRITANADTIKTWVNQIPVATLVDSVDTSGFIGLQVHQRKKGGLKVQFRHIRIKLLR